MLAFLPPHCDRPALVGPPPGPRACSLAQLARAQLEKLVHLLENEVISGFQLQEQLAALEYLLGPVENCFSHDPERRHAGATINWQRKVWADTEDHESAEQLEKYRIYDAHFGVMRMDQMTWQELAHQVISTLRRTAHDLGLALLSRENYRALLVAMHDMLEHLFPAGPKTAPLLSDPAEGIDPVAGRWRNGHHLFALCCYFGRESLHRALDLLNQEDSAQTSAQVYRAATHLAASSAAMVYTTDFPAVRYLQEIRTAMPAGFSGTHNSDFNHFKLLKGKLQVGLMRKWGTNPADWPADLLAALRHFRAIDLLDLEQHILVAASRIGMGLSLKQTHNEEQDTSAIDALRAMAQARCHDFHL